MKAQRRLGLALSWPRITSAFLLDVAVLVLASHLPIAWWVGVAGAAVVTIAAVLTYRGTPPISALAAWMWDWSSSPEAALFAGGIPTIDHRRRFGRDVVGMYEHQGQLVAAIAVDEPADAPAGRHHPQTESSPTLPVAAVAAALRQFDVCLDAIDIVSVRKRHVSEAADPSAPPTVDDHPAGVQHGTWLLLRMNPQHNVAAVAARDSLASTLAAAVERLADDLSGPRLTARPLTAVELTEVGAAVLAGLEPSLESARMASPQAFRRVCDQLLGVAAVHHFGDAGLVVAARYRCHRGNDPTHRLRRPGRGVGLGALSQPGAAG